MVCGRPQRDVGSQPFPAAAFWRAVVVPNPAGFCIPKAGEANADTSLARHGADGNPEVASL
jgi:hypothetical protein